MQFDFLICSERSGSNLITKILNAHPEVCGPFPSHMTRCFSENLYRYCDLNNDNNWDTLLDDVAFYLDNIFAEWQTTTTANMLREHVKERNLASIIRFVYETEAQAHGKIRVIAKENHTYRFAAFILAGFPDARFVWLVRDPRDMALTWKELARGGVKRGATVWREDQSKSIQLYGTLSSLNKIIMITFEDLLASPESTVRDVCTFLDLTYTDAMLRFHENDLVKKNSDKMVSWQDIQKPIQKNNTGLFRDRLSELEIRYIEAICKEEMAFFGYKPAFKNSGDPAELETLLPNPSTTDRVQTAKEKQAYECFRKAHERITSRTIHKQLDC